MESPEGCKPTNASYNDVQGSALGQETPRIRAYYLREQGRLESKDVLWGLAAHLHEQKLAKQTFWTTRLFDKIEGDILGREILLFVWVILDDELKGGDKEEAGVVERESKSPRPPPPPPLSTPPPLLLRPVQEASNCGLSMSRWAITSKRQKKVGIFRFRWMRCQITETEQRG